MIQQIFRLLIVIVATLFVTLATYHELSITRISLPYMSQKRRREIVAGWVLTGVAVCSLAIGASLVLYLPGSWKIGAATMGMFSGALFFLMAAQQFIGRISLD